MGIYDLYGNISLKNKKTKKKNAMLFVTLWSGNTMLQ